MRRVRKRRRMEGCGRGGRRGRGWRIRKRRRMEEEEEG